MDVQGILWSATAAIRAAMAGEGLTWWPERAVQGPHTVTLIGQLNDPTVGAIRRAMRVAPAVEARMGMGPVRVYRIAGRVAVEVPGPGVVIPGQNLRGKPGKIPIGIDPLRRVRGWDLDAYPGALFLGPTGQGKTAAIRLVVWHLLETDPTARIAVGALKRQDWAPLEGADRVMGPVYDPDEMADMVAWAADLVDRRVKSKQPSYGRVLVVIDDLFNVLSVAQGSMADNLARIASLGRAARVHLLLGSQRSGVKGVGDAAITANISARLVTWATSGREAVELTGRAGSGAERISGRPGDALWVAEGRVVRVAVGWLPVDALADLPRGPAEMPWRTGAPVRAGAKPGADAANEPTPTGAPVRPPQEWDGRPLRRPPGPWEMAVLRMVYKRIGSKNRTLKTVGWPKSTLTMAWLDQALSGGAP